MAAGKKKIEVKQFLRDIDGGMHTTSLMAKYGLSPGELQRVMKKLEEKGLLKQPKPAFSTPAPPVPQQPSFACPSCGAIHEKSFDECPNCGIVISKVRERAPALEKYSQPRDRQQPASQDYSSTPILGNKYFFPIMGIAALIAILCGAFLVLRWVKATQNLALTNNVQAVLAASNGATKPDYSRLAQMFGNATGATAAVMESRRTPLNEKMHELYQKLFYLGELQTRMRFREPDVSPGIGGYRQAMEAADRNKGPVTSELDSLRQGLTAGRQPLAGAAHRESPSPSQSDSTGAQFAKAEDELRSLCEQVLRMLEGR